MIGKAGKIALWLLSIAVVLYVATYLIALLISLTQMM